MEEWKVGGGMVIMVAMLSEFVVCIDSYVHFTEIEVILVNGYDVVTNPGSGK